VGWNVRFPVAQTFCRAAHRRHVDERSGSLAGCFCLVVLCAVRPAARIAVRVVLPRLSICVGMA